MTKDGLLFSTSYSDDPEHSPHSPVLQPFADGGGHYLVDPSEAETVRSIPCYAEGVNVIDGQAWTTHESGADQYQGKDGIHEIKRYGLQADR